MRAVLHSFEGFYESTHSVALENELAQVFGMESADYGTAPTQSLARAFNLAFWEANECINWREAREAYARLYVKKVNGILESALSAAGLTFESLQSPKEYNFTTDRIFVTLSPGSLRRVYESVAPLDLAEYVAENFKSRDGFASYYPADVSEWGLPERLEELDHNEAGAILDCFLRTEYATQNDGREWSDSDLMSDSNCNGELQEIIWGAAGDKLRRMMDQADSLARAIEDGLVLRVPVGVTHAAIVKGE